MSPAGVVPRAFLAAVTDMEGYDLAGFGIQRDPNQLLATFLGEEALHFVSLNRQHVDSRRTQ